MSSQSIWFAYDPQWATSIRTRLNEIDISDLWLIENVASASTPPLTWRGRTIYPQNFVAGNRVASIIRQTLPATDSIICSHSPIEFREI